MRQVGKKVPARENQFNSATGVSIRIANVAQSDERRNQGGLHEKKLDGEQGRR